MKKYLLLVVALFALSACGNSKQSAEQSITLESKEMTLASKEKALESREQTLESKEAEITDQSKTVESKEKLLDSREKGVATKESEQKEFEETIYTESSSENEIDPLDEVQEDGFTMREFLEDVPEEQKEEAAAHRNERLKIETEARKQAEELKKTEEIKQNEHPDWYNENGEQTYFPENDQFDGINTGPNFGN